MAKFAFNRDTIKFISVELFLERRQQADELRTDIEKRFLYGLERRVERLSATARQLGTLSPLAVLSRGYSVVSKPDGTVLRSAEQVSAGERIRIRFAKGGADATVETVNP